ncbi:ankyrin repeat-containing protein [Trifolium pratense]|uniref:Ankyrin repeat-containing protein n=1 Tax=Trifolium pratense TaxID=57577 RepID=A0A2K3PPD9_TRIPR|nr:ankyrin repeat-containing protein [Trifolium pratense]
MLQAAKHGNIEFINAMRNANPDLLWAAIDKNKRDIFSHAILNRRKVVFQLIHDETVNGRKEIVRCRVDAFGNSLLHLAGKLGPLSDLHRRSGPALQMQRELLWFKEVEKLVHPKCKEAKNAEGKKPRHIFTENHKELVKAGEKWAKHTAGSFTLVATLITTIMFAAAFTVPVLLFIGILTARYAENDFLKSLPLKLLFGLIALFFSVVSMMVAFCASLAMLLKGHEGIIITAMSFACIPVIVLLPSQLRLFIEIFKSMSDFYCSLFPEDYLIDDERLIQLWTAEGFLTIPTNNNPEQFGQACFNDFVPFIFQQVEEKEEKGVYRMNQLLHKLAKEVAGDENIAVDSMGERVKEGTLHASFDFGLKQRN